MFRAKISLAGSGRTGIRQNRPLFPGQLSEVIDETVGHDRTCTDDRARWDDRLLARPACAGDERGSGQYNLALGQRRADSAKKYLATLGVHSGQITAISFGAEKPKALGHDEDAWKQNRRDDLTARR